MMAELDETLQLNLIVCDLESILILYPMLGKGLPLFSPIVAVLCQSKMLCNVEDASN